MQRQLHELLNKGKKRGRCEEQQCNVSTRLARNSNKQRFQQPGKSNLFSVLKAAVNTVPHAKAMPANPFAWGAANPPWRQFGRGGSPGAPARPSQFSTNIPSLDPEQHERQPGSQGFKQAAPINAFVGQENRQFGRGSEAWRTVRAQPGVAAAHHPPQAAEYQRAYLDIDPAVEAKVAARRAAKAEERRRQQQEAEEQHRQEQEAAAEMKNWRAAQAEQRRERANAQKAPPRTTRLSAEDTAWPRNEWQQWAYGGDYEAWMQSEQEWRGASEYGRDSYTRPPPRQRGRGFDDADPDDHWGTEEGSPRRRYGQDCSSEEGAGHSAGDGWGHSMTNATFPISWFIHEEYWCGGAAEGQSGGGSSASDKGTAHADDEAYSHFSGEEGKRTWQQHSGAGGEGDFTGAPGGYHDYYYHGCDGQRQRTYQRQQQQQQQQQQWQQQQRQQQQQRGPVSGEDAARAAAKAVHAAQQKVAAVTKQDMEVAVEVKVAEAVRTANGNIAAFATALGVRYGPAVGGAEGIKAARKALLLRFHPDKLLAASEKEQLMGQHITRALNTMPK